MAKVKVNGPSADPIWKLAKAGVGSKADIGWNFDGVFLFDKAGTPVDRSSVRKPPTAEQVKALL